MCYLICFIRSGIILTIPLHSPLSEGSLPFSKQPTACPCAEPDEFSPVSPIYAASLDSHGVFPMELELSGLHVA
jgi:hypothetical protein